LEGNDSRAAREATNKALMAEYLEGFWNHGDHALAERYVATDAYFHDFEDAPTPIPQGLAGVKEVYRGFRDGFPDIRMDVEDMIAEDDKVLVRWTVKGQHTGNFQGIPPTHKTIDFDGMSVVRIANGQIVEGWSTMNVMKGMQQLGIVPSGTIPAPLRWLISLRGQRHARKLRKQQSAG
jgi:steroid delta-isomerase-like uncharacterized protein